MLKSISKTLLALVFPILSLTSVSQADSRQRGNAPSSTQLRNDFETNIAILRLPPAQRAEVARRVLIAAGIISSGTYVSGTLAARLSTGAFVKIALGMRNTGLFFGALLIIDGAAGYLSDGRFMPVAQIMDAAFSIRGAQAATLSEHYLESPEAYSEFLSLAPVQALAIMQLSPELTAIVQTYASSYRDYTSKSEQP